MGLFVITAAAVAYGVAAGLLLPRAAYRLSVEPDAAWRDRCPEGHPIPGWLGLPRCRDAAPSRPSARPRHTYGMGLGWAVGTAAVGCGGLAWAIGGRPEGVVFVAAVPVLLLLGIVDLTVQRLPDVLTLPLAGALAAGLGGAALVPGAAGSWTGALAGGSALAGAYLLLFLLNPAGLGFGDVKLALALGVTLGWYGWGVWAAGAFLGFLYGALYGLTLVLRGRAGRRTGFPFGPFMAAGALTGVLLGGFGA
ncbi:peptidase A24 [Streptomyces sp. WM6372]|uniref:prepilin peptidase n=1 Tax=Streptomyces sp. WM6372 TaxID=1415555 RepID=UPI0006AE43D5|nr:A24 family peptidase [Streptomyces sp. WM6372]KOU24109.1 peptidase A24 [Streptomyces sp. WM6372]